jgi:predicted nucleic-acid-binding protein
MSILVESSTRQLNDNNGVDGKLYAERKILIELIKIHQKTFAQEKLCFEDFFANIIESKLSEALGEAIVTVIKNYLKEKFSLELRDAAKKPEEFFISLEKIFGKSICTIERLILNDIKEKIKF